MFHRWFNASAVLTATWWGPKRINTCQAGFKTSQLTHWGLWQPFHVQQPHHWGPSGSAAKGSLPSRFTRMRASCLLTDNYKILGGYCKKDKYQNPQKKWWFVSVQHSGQSQISEHVPAHSGEENVTNKGYSYPIPSLSFLMPHRGLQGLKSRGTGAVRWRQTDPVKVVGLVHHHWTCKPNMAGTATPWVLCIASHTQNQLIINFTVLHITAVCLLPSITFTLSLLSFWISIPLQGNIYLVHYHQGQPIVVTSCLQSDRRGLHLSLEPRRQAAGSGVCTGHPCLNV